MASGSRGGGGSDFSVVVVGSDAGAGAALLVPSDRHSWHDCLAEADACFSDLEERQVVRVQGTDRARRTIVRVVGKFFPGARIGHVFAPLTAAVARSGVDCYEKKK
jgi:hypothetical protein